MALDLRERAEETRRFRGLWGVLAAVLVGAALAHASCGTTKVGPGGDCYDLGMWDRALGVSKECEKGLRCNSSGDWRCIKVVGEGKKCDGKPYPNPHNPQGYRECSIMDAVPNGSGYQDVGVCVQGRCVRSTKYGKGKPRR